MIKGDVIQFNENHKWCGCLGIITETKVIHKTDEDGVNESDIRYMVGVPIPQQGTAFIFTMESDNEIEYVGKAVLTLKDDESE